MVSMGTIKLKYMLRIAIESKKTEQFTITWRLGPTACSSQVLLLFSDHNLIIKDYNPLIEDELIIFKKRFNSDCRELTFACTILGNATILLEKWPLKSFRNTRLSEDNLTYPPPVRSLINVSLIN
jgi:hypothetical protein